MQVKVKDGPDSKIPSQIPNVNEIPRETKNEDVGEFLDSLVKKSRFSKTFNIFGIPWEFSTLSQEDIIEAGRETGGLSEKEDLSNLTEVAVSFLSRSIRAIGGKSLSEIFGVEGRKNEIRALKSYLGKLAPEVVSELFDAYIQIAEERSKVLESLKKK